MRECIPQQCNKIGSWEVVINLTKVRVYLNSVLGLGIAQQCIEKGICSAL